MVYQLWLLKESKSAFGNSSDKNLKLYFKLFGFGVEGCEIKCKMNSCFISCHIR